MQRGFWKELQRDWLSQWGIMEKTGLDTIQKGMLKEEKENEKIAEGFNLLKVAIY